ncbi:uncharacterized protein HaLaN_18513, partial [Haematococcus lacustris]
VEQPAGGLWAGAEQPAGGQRAGIGQPAGGQWAGTEQPAGGQWAGTGQPAGGQWAGTGQPAGGQWAGRGQPAGGQWARAGSCHGLCILVEQGAIGLRAIEQHAIGLSAIGLRAIGLPVIIESIVVPRHFPPRALFLLPRGSAGVAKSEEGRAVRDQPPPFPLGNSPTAQTDSQGNGSWT